MTQPFLRWPGGKSKLLSTIRALLPGDWRERRYFEPFIGGGAVFFGLAPRAAHLSDANVDLIKLYAAVRDDVETLLQHLRVFAEYHDEGAYYRMRDAFNAGDGTPVVRAATMLYLNRTCFNGVWRVNGAGGFNVPYGDRPCVVDVDALRLASAALQGTSLRCAGFADALDAAGEGDFVYLDPPYAGGFASYTASGFPDAEQYVLRDICDALTSRGVLWLQSNSDHPLIRSLYSEYPTYEVDGPRSVRPGTAPARELLIRNY